MPLKTAIIIVAYNGREHIARCLASVLKTRYGGQFGVIVVDNNSSDDTVDIIEKSFPQVRLIKLEKNLGFVGGNNLGIKEALSQDYGYVVLLNQDTEVEYDWLAQLVKAAQPASAGIVQAMLLLGNERALTNNVGNAWHYLGFGFLKHYRERVDSWYHRPPFSIGYASGAAMLIKREVLEKVGVFDDKFFSYHEDLDLCWRARLSGYEVLVAPQAVVYHYYEFNRNQKMFYWSERNRWMVLLQNYSLAALCRLIPLLLAVEIGVCFYSLAGGWFWQKAKSYFWLLVYLPAIIRRRGYVQARRLASDRELAPFLDYNLDFPHVQSRFLKTVASPAAAWYFKKFFYAKKS